MNIITRTVAALVTCGHNVTTEHMIPGTPGLYRVDDGHELTEAQFVQVYGHLAALTAPPTP